MTANRPMWECPRCGRTFAKQNQWHSCGSFSVQGHLEHQDPEKVRLFRVFERMARACGPITISPSKTIIAFKAHTTFAAARFVRDGLRVGVLLPRRLDHPRFVKVQTLSPRSHEHVFVIRAPDDLDADVEAWLREAYQVGSRSGRVG